LIHGVRHYFFFGGLSPDQIWRPLMLRDRKCSGGGDKVFEAPEFNGVLPRRSRRAEKSGGAFADFRENSNQLVKRGPPGMEQQSNVERLIALRIFSGPDCLL